MDTWLGRKGLNEDRAVCGWDGAFPERPGQSEFFLFGDGNTLCSQGLSAWPGHPVGCPSQVLSVGTGDCCPALPPQLLWQVIVGGLWSLGALKSAGLAVGLSSSAPLLSGLSEPQSSTVKPEGNSNVN